jgi:hypothetical protein
LKSLHISCNSTRAFRLPASGPESCPLSVEGHHHRTDARRDVSGVVEKNLEKSWENTVHQTERETKPSTPSMMTMISMNVVVGLLALCRVGTANADSGKIFDPNVFTDEEKQYIIDTYAGEGLIQYGKVRAFSSHAPIPRRLDSLTLTLPFLSRTLVVRSKSRITCTRPIAVVLLSSSCI